MASAVKRRSKKASQAAPQTPRGERRREALQAAAQDVFLEHGYAGASIDEVVRRTGGSKASLYSYFGNKDGLFGAMVELACADFLRNVAIPTRIEGDLEKTLNAFGLRFFALYTDPQRVRLMRAIIAEANRFPLLAQKLYEHGPQRARIQLAAFFAECHEQGALHAPNADYAAIQFITLVKGHCQFRSLFGLSPLAIDMPPKTFIRETVRLFLHGTRAAPPKRP